jgi:hypothetical protein
LRRTLQPGHAQDDAANQREGRELVFGGHAAELVVVHQDDLVTELADKQSGG